MSSSLNMVKFGMPEKCLNEESGKYLDVRLECKREVWVFPGL